MKIKHFLISRFNINFSFYLSEISLKEQLAWMDYRVYLFFELAYPTLLSQTTRNFKWILLLDENSPVSVLNKIRGLDIDNLLFFVFTSNENLQRDINLFLKETVNSNDLVITTTLDSDDGLMPYAIENIQKIAVSYNSLPLGINIFRGYIVNVQTGVFFKKSFRSNPFYSLVEMGIDFKTCLYKEHMYMSSTFNTIELNDMYYWIQNIHGGNILNQVKGVPILFNSNLPSSIYKLYRKPNFNSYLFAIIFYFKSKIRNAIIKINRKLNV